jgi:hypothetical protein
VATLIDYRGLQVVSPNPTGDGGLAIQDNFKSLVDWNPKGVWNQAASPTTSDDNTEEYFPGSLWLRTDTTPSQLFVCKSSATGTASWLPILLNVAQDSSPKLGGDLDLNGFKIADSTSVTLDVSGHSVATVTSSSLQIQGNFLLGTTTTPSGAMFNSVLGGGATSPVLGAPTADLVSLAAVDKMAGDRRLYIQSELGSAISLGNNRLNFAASTGLISVGGTDLVSATSNTVALNPTAVGGISYLSVNYAGAGTQNTDKFLVLTSPGIGSGSYWIYATSTGIGGSFLVRGDGSVAIGTTVFPTSATFNLVLGGGAASPALGAATVDTVTVAAVDKAAGDRRLYIQSEGGSPISVGNNTLNYASSAGFISVGGTNTLAATSAYVQVNTLGVGTAPNPTTRAIEATKAFADPAATAIVCSLSSVSTLSANNSNVVSSFQSDTRLNQGGFNLTGGIRSAISGAYATGSSGTVTQVISYIGQAGNLGAGAVTNCYFACAQSALNSGGGTLTNNHGFFCDAQTAGNNIYGFRGSIVAATNRWNIYMDGTAANYLNGTLLMGTTTIPAGATYNLILGGGTSTPSLGTATADQVNLAAVDTVAGDRRFYIQSELGSSLSLGNDRFNYAASTGYVSVGGTDLISVTATATSLLSTTDATSSSTGALQLNGGAVITKNLLALQGHGWGVTLIATAAGTTTLTGSSKTIQIFTGTTTQTVTLPAANSLGSGIGLMFVIKNLSSGTVTISRIGSDTIDGNTSTTLVGGLKSSVSLVSDGTSQWVII